ncbi:sensor histidine kinase [Actinoplanes sp. G11-F43]|uniref:sensor histidine kinase n=1 Tax=Actinoplanes sp. G11-F43 TaxID=3424130 RepID=UPI003D325AFF
MVDLAAAPIAVVWATAALYRGQMRDAELRQNLIDQLRGAREELARRQHQAGVLSERARLAREIHDTLAQDLAAHRTLLQAADRDWPAFPERARGRMLSVTESLGDNLTQVRRMIADLTPYELEDRDLVSALDLLCERERARGTAAEVEFEAIGDPPVLGPPETATLLRIAQGALANVREHAHARHVRITLQHRDGEVALRVSDDGSGFTMPGSTGEPARGYGLAGMRQRLRSHGGELSVESTLGGGTVLTGRLPATRLAVAG